MIFEFVGFPGTGKTTLAEKLAKETNIPIISRVSMKKNLFKMGMFFVRHPLIALNVVRCIYRKESTPQCHKKRLFKEILTKYIDLRGDTIFDEGLIQRFAAMVPPGKFKKSGKILGKISSQHIIVLCEAPKTICLERIAKRGRMPRAKFLNAKERDEWLLDIEENMEYIKQVNILNTNSTFINVETADINSAHKELYKKVSKILKS